MNEDSSEGKKSSYKVAGMIVAGVLIVLALIIFSLSKIEIKKKPTSTSTQSNKTEVSQTSNQSETSVSSNKEDKSISANSDDITLLKIKNEDKLDYTVSELETTGVVSNKSCYLQENQVIYLLDISIGAGASYLDVKYYCPYDTYTSVNENDIVTVKYKQVSDSAFAVTSVHK